jgi:hypothetical protein
MELVHTGISTLMVIDALRAGAHIRSDEKKRPILVVGERKMLDLPPSFVQKLKSVEAIMLVWVADKKVWVYKPTFDSSKALRRYERQQKQIDKARKELADKLKEHEKQLAKRVRLAVMLNTRSSRSTNSKSFKLSINEAGSDK